MDLHPIQGRVVMLLVTLCWVSCDGLAGSSAVPSHFMLWNASLDEPNRWTNAADWAQVSVNLFYQLKRTVLNRKFVFLSVFFVL